MSNDSQLVRGTLLLTSATMISRILGLIYYFPFLWLVGTKGAALYAYAYNPYTILLSISTMGLPLAVSKFVSKYNALEDYRTGYRLFRSGLVLLSITGFLAALALFLVAPVIAPMFIGGNGGGNGNTLEDVILVIRWVSPALLLVPMMSLVRGYFQGFQSMGPTAVSQVIEQVVRIVFILTTSFFILKVMHGPLATAVSLATFAAFVGAIGGMAVLIWYWLKRQKDIKKRVLESKTIHEISLFSMYKELMLYAIPFILVGLAIPIYQQIDTFTVNKALMSLGYTLGQAEDIFAILNQTSQKVIMIPVSLATALGLTIIPAITRTFTAGDKVKLHNQITQTFNILLYLTLPAAVGLGVLSYQVYGSLYAMSEVDLGSYLLAWYAPTTIFYALFTVTAAILQGINRQKYAVYGLIGGILLKIAFNYEFVQLFEGKGAILSTDLGYGFSILFNLWIIKKFAGYSYRPIIKSSMTMVVHSTVMGLAVWLVKWLFILWLPGGKEHFLNTVITLVVSLIVGIGVYLWLGLRSNLAVEILGNRIAFLKKKNVQK
ncbi:putative polysaccharide biosynthesis protein [Tepidibacillus sp. LV47]|uniref:putative polysaccharide biosynthesis protein n=1 Tax=Tepidibacillus sp. LV47 TaxID=3398228 RepID=UPI003AB01E5D